MKRFAIRRIIFSFCLLIVTALQAELLILKKTAEGLATLTHNESLRYGPVISQIILKYQWPMCIASNLTKEEKDELLTPGIPNAEEIFIQKKLQQAIPELDIQVAFIPTTLYELFCICEYVKSSFEATTSLIIDFDKSSFERAAMVLVSEYLILYRNKEGRARLIDLSKRLDNVFNLFNLSKANVYDIYNSYNELFFSTNMQVVYCKNVKENYVCDKSNSTALFNKRDINAYMYINNRFLDYILSILQNNLVRIEDESNTSVKIYKNIENILSELIQSTTNMLEPRISDEFLKKYTRISPWLNDIQTLKTHAKLLKKIIELEYESTAINKTILFRGSNLLDGQRGQMNYIGTVKDKNIDDFIASILVDDDNSTIYSISLGQSLFAGSILDGALYSGACAYSYLIDKWGYALFIDKKEYIRSQNNGLFFIASLSTLASLFGKGEFFHARTKLSLTQQNYNVLKNGGEIKLRGISEKDLQYNSLLMARRNPWVQAELFSDFVAQNGVFLNGRRDSAWKWMRSDELVKKEIEEAKKAKKIFENQKKLANVYAKVQQVELAYCHLNEKRLEKLKKLENYRREAYPDQHPFAATTAREYGL